MADPSFFRRYAVGMNVRDVNELREMMLNDLRPPRSGNEEAFEELAGWQGRYLLDRAVVGSGWVVRFECVEAVSYGCSLLAQTRAGAEASGMVLKRLWYKQVRHLRIAGFDQSTIGAALELLKPKLVSAAQAEIARKDKEAAADERATALLVRCLTPKQAKQFEKNGSFTVTVPSRGAFTIRSSRTYNVRHRESGRDFCLGFDTRLPELPLADQLLAQKLLLETDPDSFFATANEDRLSMSMGAHLPEFDFYREAVRRQMRIFEMTFHTPQRPR